MARHRWKRYSKASPNYTKNHGVVGVVYILDNPGLKDGWYKIGCSRHSGATRAGQLNFDANTGTPGSFICLFEHKTLDCGNAEVRVFEQLKERRRGKWGQEFFEVDIEHAKSVIIEVCTAIDCAVIAAREEEAKRSAEKQAFAPPPLERPEPSPIPSPEIEQIINSNSRQVWWGWKLAAGYIIFLLILACYENITKQKPPMADLDFSRVTGQSGGQTPKFDVSKLRPAFVPKSFKPAESDDALSKIGKTADNELARGSSDDDKLIEDANKTSSKNNPAKPERANVLPITQAERMSIESACGYEWRINGPAAYYRCFGKQLEMLHRVSRNFDLSGVTQGESQSIESACDYEQRINGPAAYYQCWSKQLAMLKAAKGNN